jgi:aminopeptidase YwaD
MGRVDCANAITIQEYHMSRLVLLLPLLCLLAEPATAQTGSPEITSEELREHVRYLASDALQGRGSGSEGNAAAAAYIERHIKLYGLKPGGASGGYYQPFDFISAVKLGEKNTVTVKGPGIQGGAKTLTVDKDFRPFGFSSTGAANGELVFVGYGVSAPEKQYDDYAGIDVKDKIVVMLRYGPDGSSPRGDFQRHTGLRNKARIAREKGAAAMIMLNGPADESDDNLYRLALDQGAGSSGIIALSMKRDVLDAAFDRSGWTLKGLQDSMRASLKPRSFPLADSRADLEIEVLRVTSTTSNIVGYIEGTDPLLKNEVVILGAHMDHLGMGGPGSGSMSPDTIAIHNGADDNASGTASLLELAQAFGARSSALHRTYVFAFFSGEELGTLGSAHYVTAPTFPLNQSVAMLNMDMVGRLQDRKLSVGGTGTSPVWPEFLTRHNADSTFALTFNPDGFGPSDHAVFYGKDIPVLFFFSGTHDDYHKPSDDWDKLNYDGQQKIAQYVEAIVGDIDTMRTRPGFVRVQVASSGRGGAGGDSRGFSVTLGIVPDVSEGSTGMKISGIRPNGPAEKAGLKAGDIILSMGGKKILNVYDYMGILGELKAGDEVTVEVNRDGTLMELKASMQKRN